MVSVVDPEAIPNEYQKLTVIIMMTMMTTVMMMMAPLARFSLRWHKHVTRNSGLKTNNSAYRTLLALLEKQIKVWISYGSCECQAY